MPQFIAGDGVRLPVYKGYTVDYRLKQFRKIPLNRMPEFIEFGDEKGDELLCELIDKDLIPHDILVQLF